MDMRWISVVDSLFNILITIEMHLQLSAVEIVVFIYAFRVSTRYD